MTTATLPSIGRPVRSVRSRPGEEPAADVVAHPREAQDHGALEGGVDGLGEQRAGVHGASRRERLATASTGIIGQPPEQGQRVPAGAAPAVGAEPGGVGRAHRPAAQHDGGVHRAPQRGDGLGDGRVVARGGGGDAHRHQPLGGAGGIDEGRGRGVRAQVDHGEALAPQQVGEQRRGQRVAVAGGGAEHDRAPLAAAAGELGPQAPDESVDHHRGLVLLADGDGAGVPLVADDGQRRGDDLEVDVGGVGAGGHGVLDDDPRPRLVTCHQAGHQAPGVVHPTRGGRRPGVGRRHEGGEVLGLHPPLHPDLAPRQPSGAHVAVDGHVVDAEPLGRLVERDEAVGGARHRGGEAQRAGRAARSTRAARRPPAARSPMRRKARSTMGLMSR